MADTLNFEFATTFVGRPSEGINLTIAVDRRRQAHAFAWSTSQAETNPVLWRRLHPTGDEESLRWLRPPR